MYQTIDFAALDDAENQHREARQWQDDGRSQGESTDEGWNEGAYDLPEHQQLMPSGAEPEDFDSDAVETPRFGAKPTHAEHERLMAEYHRAGLTPHGQGTREDTTERQLHIP